MSTIDIDIVYLGGPLHAATATVSRVPEWIGTDGIRHDEPAYIRAASPFATYWYSWRGAIAADGRRVYEFDHEEARDPREEST